VEGRDFIKRDVELSKDGAGERVGRKGSVCRRGKRKGGSRCGDRWGCRRRRGRGERVNVVKA